MAETEGEQLEFKQSLNEWKEAVQTVAAFATTHGGQIRIGVRPDGGAAGIELGNRTLEQLADQIKTNTDPPQYPLIGLEGPENAAVITIRVEEAPVKPVAAFGLAYKRVGRTNQRLTMDEAHRLREASTGRTWDALIHPQLRLEHLSAAEVQRFLRRASQDPGTPLETVLTNLSLIGDAGLTNGAALLFAADPQRFVPGSHVKCARFSGTTSVTFLDEQTLDGTVFTQVEQALAFVTRNTRQGIQITGQPERETLPEYPTEAIREAITNAVCHRDYAAAGTVQIRIYDDRLEVWNPGELPPGLTVEDLYREHPSRPRNKLIAQALYRARFIEHWGTGTLRIVQASEAAGMPTPEFRSEMGMFIVRFPSLAPSLQIQEEGLSVRARELVAYLRQRGRITSPEYAELFSLRRRQAQKDLTALTERGAIVRKGGGRWVHYVLR